MDSWPVAPAAIVNDGRSVPSQVGWITTSPCWPAPGPVIDFFTTRLPGFTKLYVSVMVAVVVPASIVTGCPDPSTCTVTVLVCPSWISVTVHSVPTGMLSYVLDVVPVDPAGMSNGSPIRAPPQRTLIVTAPC